jgi:hypothetical protein
MNSGIWTKNEQNIYNQHILHIINKNISFKQLSLIMKTRKISQIKSHHQKSYNNIKKISLILLQMKYTQ